MSWLVCRGSLQRTSSALSGQHASPVLSLRRTFFTLPDPFSISPFKGLNETPAVQTYHEQKILSYKRSQLYEIVADVASYPCFVPFCTGSRILGVSEQPQQGSASIPTVMDAELTVGFLAFKESYVSRVTCNPFESVEAVASSSTPLFRTLVTKWHFHPAPRTNSSLHRPQPSRHPFIGECDDSTLITLDLTFAFANPLYTSISSAFFTQISKLMVKAFEDQCHRVYGPPNM